MASSKRADTSGRSRHAAKSPAANEASGTRSSTSCTKTPDARAERSVVAGASSTASSAFSARRASGSSGPRGARPDRPPRMRVYDVTTAPACRSRRRA